MKCPTVGTIYLASALTVISLPGYANGILEGLYEIQTRTLLPHLEEMRRNITTATACLGRDEVKYLFPILKQPGLVNCTFTKLHRTKTTTTYTLQCPGKNAAVGEANLKIDGGKISGELNAKLGGKNMTFSQFTEAILVGECQH